MYAEIYWFDNPTTANTTVPFLIELSGCEIKLYVSTHTLIVVHFQHRLQTAIPNSCNWQVICIYIYAFSRRFYPKRLRLYFILIFLSVHVFPGNRTHNLCAANAMLYHWTTGTLFDGYIVHALWLHSCMLILNDRYLQWYNITWQVLYKEKLQYMNHDNCYANLIVHPTKCPNQWWWLKDNRSVWVELSH